MHYGRMSKRDPPPTPFHANLRKMVAAYSEKNSVNLWAIKHGLDQTTVNRILAGQDPKLSTVMKIAEKTELDPWQLLLPDLDHKNPPVIRGASETEQRLWKKIDNLLSELGELREMATTRPGTLAED